MRVRVPYDSEGKGLRFHGVPEAVNGRRPLLALNGRVDRPKLMSAAGGKADSSETRSARDPDRTFKAAS